MTQPYSTDPGGLFSLENRTYISCGSSRVGTVVLLGVVVDVSFAPFISWIHLILVVYILDVVNCYCYPTFTPHILIFFFFFLRIYPSTLIKSNSWATFKNGHFSFKMKVKAISSKNVLQCVGQNKWSITRSREPHVCQKSLSSVGV